MGTDIEIDMEIDMEIDLDIDMAPQRREQKRVQHLSFETNLHQYVVGAWCCHDQLRSRRRTRLHVEGCIPTVVIDSAQAQQFLSKAMVNAFAKCM